MPRLADGRNVNCAASATGAFLTAITCARAAAKAACAVVRSTAEHAMVLA
jgi:hypothetical protein